MKDHLKPIVSLWFWPTLFAFAALLRYGLPGIPAETAPIHDAIIQSIMDGNKWGLMALVKIPDVPLVPTLALLLFKNLFEWTALNPIALLCAFSQATIFTMIARALPKTLPRPVFTISILAMLCLPAIPLLGNFLMLDDCNWISAIPLTHTILMLHKADDNASEGIPLTAVLAVACDLALLVFCGPIMMFSTLFIMLYLLVRLHRLHAPKGTACILLMPMLYALLLWLPWYSPNDDNIFTETFVAYQKLEVHHCRPAVSPAILGSLLLAFTFLYVVHWYSKKHSQPDSASTDSQTTDDQKEINQVSSRHEPANLESSSIKATWALGMSSLLVSPFLMFLGLAQTGLGQTIVVSYAILILTLASEMDVIGMFREWKRFGSLRSSLTLGTIASAICLALAITFGFVYPDIATFERATPQTIAQHAPPPPDIFDYQDAPSRERLAALADSHWPGSRIVVCGRRLTEVVYPDEEQTRFRPMETFSPDEFVELASAEQLNLLVPPNDGRFYDSDSPLADIHANGAPYLFPLAILPGGWQLWCSIPPPTFEQ